MGFAISEFSRYFWVGFGVRHFWDFRRLWLVAGIAWGGGFGGSLFWFV